MRTLGLLLLVCAACAKKPAPKAPAPPPPAAEPGQKPADSDKQQLNTPSTGDPCDGGEIKPH